MALDKTLAHDCGSVFLKEVPQVTETIKPDLNVLVAMPRWRYERLIEVENLVDTVLSRYDLWVTLGDSTEGHVAKSLLADAVSELRKYTRQEVADVAKARI